MSTITYADKSAGDLFTPADANEIKSVVNANVGLTEWSATYTYAKDQIVQYQGVFVKSVQDSNLNHTPDITTGGDTTWWEVVKTGGSLEIEGTVATTTSANKAMYFNTDGKLAVADNSSISTAIVSGFLQAATSGTDQPGVIVSGGLMSGFTFDAGDVGAKAYLGTSGDVVLRDEVPNTAYLVSLGVIVSTTELSVQIGMPEWNPARYDDGNPVGSLHRFPTYKDRPGYLPFAFDNAVKKSLYPDLYAEVGDVFEAMHVAAGDSASAADEFYPTPIPGYYERTGYPDIIFTDADVDVVANTITHNIEALRQSNSGRDGTIFRFEVLSGTNPGGLSDGDLIYANFNAGSLTLVPCTSEAGAIDGSAPIDITSAGSGTFRLTQEGVEIGDAFQGHRLRIFDENVLGGTEELGQATGGATGTATGTFNTFGDLFAGSPYSDGINGTPRTSNETRPATLYEFGYIKAEKGLPAGEPVSALRYDTGWVANSDWTSALFTITHGFGVSADQLNIEFMVSPNTDGSVIVFPEALYKDTSGGSATSSAGWNIRGLDENTVEIRTGADGLGYLNDGYGISILTTGSWYYRVVVTKPEISGKVYEKIKESTTVTGDYTYTGIEETINVDAATATITLDSLDRKLKVRKVNSGAGTITINPPAGATFTRAGLSSVTLTSDGDFWVFEPVSSTRIDLVDGVESGFGVGSLIWKKTAGGHGEVSGFTGALTSYNITTASGSLFTGTLPSISMPITLSSLCLTASSPSIWLSTITVSSSAITLRGYFTASLPSRTDGVFINVSGRWYA